MTQLMLNYNAKECQLRDRHVFLRAHNFVRIGNATDVFHSSVFVIRAHNMVHFCKRITLAEALLVKINGRLCYSEHEIISHVLNERLSDENSLGYIHRIVVFKDAVGSSTDGIQVS